jgi:hypothetical protein
MSRSKGEESSELAASRGTRVPDGTGRVTKDEKLQKRVARLASRYEVAMLAHAPHYQQRRLLSRAAGVSGAPTAATR